ncbi:MAG TPA: SAM-dependent chlorinase/fluorinase, partial [Gemmataceae bacterium]|nr:SAM-dependent chlorinase/fluorinase [Gemmataceae bacterium]
MLVTLSTDFGAASPYVAAMKGVLLGVNRDARLLDLSHSLPPQNIRHAAYFLAQAVPYFPDNTLHVCVVDPGVGTERAILYAEAGSQRLLAPDNGCLTEVLKVLGGPTQIRRLAEEKFWRRSISSTFHGRDIFAPVAGHLSHGLNPTELGPEVTDIVQLELPQPRQGESWLEGEVAFVDDFGNLISNVPVEMLPTTFQVTVGDQEIRHFVRSYAEAKPGELISLISSDGHLEVALVNGNASQRLRADSGTA